MAAKALKPRLRFSGFTDAWEKRQLGEVVEKYDKPVVTPSSGYERLGLRSHAKGTFHSYVEKGQELETAKMFEVAADKFILNITFAWEHAVAITDINDAGKLVSHRFPQFSFKESLKASFFKYLMLDKKFKFHLQLSSPGGAGRNRVLKIDEMLQYNISFPTLPEQTAIGTFFSQLDRAIALQERKCQTMKHLKKTLLKKMFPENDANIPALRFAGFTDDWEKRQLGEVVEIVMGQSPDSKNYTDNPLDNILVQGNADLKNGFVVPRVWTTQITKTAEKGDLILSVRAPVGEVGKTNYDVVLGRGVAGIKGNEFIYHSLVRMNRFGYWIKLSTGSTFESINSEDIKNAVINFPTLPEQTAIGSFFSQLDRAIALQEKKLENMKTTKKTLLKLMFV